MSSYPGLLATRAEDDDMVVFSKPREVIKEDEIAGMTAGELRAARTSIARVLAAIDAQLQALAASDQPDGDPTLAGRVREARRALNDASKAQPDADVQKRADEVKRAMRGKR
jgi:hypothetical protein